MYLRGFTKSPAFLQPRGIPPPVFERLHYLSIIYNNILNSENQKMSQSFSNNTNSLNTTVNLPNATITNNLTLADDRYNLLCWSSPLDPKLKHHDIQARRVENVGEWLLQTEEFRNWDAGSGGSESNNAVLFCYGGGSWRCQNLY